VEPSQPTELIVVRHGETLWNLDGRQQGHLDSPLSPLGVRQADAIAARLAEERFDALYSSDLGRARATAQRIAARTGHAVRVDERLRERHLGIIQGLTMSEFERLHPEEHARFNSGGADFRVPGGESIRQRHERVVACAEEIAARHPGQRVVIVTHGGVLSSLFRRAAGISVAAPRTFRLWNASINTFFVEGGKWALGVWGDISHLKGLPTADDF